MSEFFKLRIGPNLWYAFAGWAGRWLV